MRQRHGIPDARKVAVMSGDRQYVSVTDGEGEVLLSIGTSDYPAGLTIEQARFIALQLDEASDRVEGKRQTDGRSKGGQAGGRARAERLSPERRKEISTAAANARWKK